MKYLYGEFTRDQIEQNLKIMHNEVHKLLLYKDAKVENKIFESDEDFYTYFNNLLFRFGGMNNILGQPVCMIGLMSTLRAAYDFVSGKDYSYKNYRRLILDAHGYISKIMQEV